MNLPFTTDQFLNVFRLYNQSVWPTQIVLLLLALTAIGLLDVRHRMADRVISAILAFLWAWMALAYHISFFTVINPAAWLFAALFLTEAVLLTVSGIVRPGLEFHNPGKLRVLLGAIFLIYALALYPALNYSFGHSYPEMPTFGLPCPTTIFTLGMLMFAKRIPGILLPIPLIWALIGTSAAIVLGIYEDFGLFISGLIIVSVLIYTYKNPHQSKAVD